MSASVMSGSISEMVPTKRGLADRVATGDDDLHRHREAVTSADGGTSGRPSSTDPLQQPLEQPHVAVLGRSGLTHLHHAGATRSPTSTRTTPTGVPRRAASSATDIGVWQSSTMRRSSGVAPRPSWSGVISASDRRVELERAERRSRAAAREHVRTTTPRRTRCSASPRSCTSCRRTAVRTWCSIGSTSEVLGVGADVRSSDRRSRERRLQLGDEAGRRARSRTSRRGRPSRSRPGRRRRVVPSSPRAPTCR